MNNNLVPFNCIFDRVSLYNEACDLKGYETFIDPKTQLPIHGWLIKRIDSGYGSIISNFFKNYFQLKDCRPRFYIQEVGVSIPFHKDRGTQCSFNFVLTDDPDPITFRDETLIYTTALLNTSVDHAVLNPKKKRILFKLSIFDKSFDEIKNVLPSKLQIR